jgi:hypothetical protein
MSTVFRSDNKSVIFSSDRGEAYFFVSFAGSSVINTISYYSHDNTLSVSFVSGDFYLYDGVSFDKAVEVLSAESIGAWFNANIRGQHEYHKYQKSNK